MSDEESTRADPSEWPIRGASLLGLGLIFWGTWLIHFPAALIVLGFGILIDCWILKSLVRGG